MILSLRNCPICATNLSCMMICNVNKDESDIKPAASPKSKRHDSDVRCGLHDEAKTCLLEMSKSNTWQHLLSQRESLQLRMENLTLPFHVIGGVDALEPLLTQHEAARTSARDPRVCQVPSQVQGWVYSLGDKVLRRRYIIHLITKAKR